MSQPPERGGRVLASCLRFGKEYAGLAPRNRRGAGEGGRPLSQEATAGVKDTDFSSVFKIAEPLLRCNTAGVAKRLSR